MVQGGPIADGESAESPSTERCHGAVRVLVRWTRRGGEERRGAGHGAGQGASGSTCPAASQVTLHGIIKTLKRGWVGVIFKHRIFNHWGEGGRYFSSPSWWEFGKQLGICITYCSVLGYSRVHVGFGSTDKHRERKTNIRRNTEYRRLLVWVVGVCSY